MPSYTRPGVYVEESLAPLAQSVSRPGEATAAFVGAVSRGPQVPTSVSSWREFVKVFGDLDGGDLCFAVWLYFANGGRGAWVSRAVADDAVAAGVTVANLDSDPAFDVTASSVGVWGNTVYVTIAEPGIVDEDRPGRFDLTVKVGGTDSRYIVERFNDLSLDPADGRYAPSIVNSPSAGSRFVVLSAYALSGDYDASLHAPETQTDTVLTGGDDGSSVNISDAIAALEVVEGVLVLNVPGYYDQTTVGEALDFATARGDVFVVVDAPGGESGDTASDNKDDILGILPGGIGALPTSSLLAVYGPHLTIADPRSTSGAAVTVPPGGAVVGKYIATDALKGVQKPAAGVNTVLSGVLALAFRYTSAQQDELFAKGFNLIKVVPGAGFVIWGARTLASGTPDRSVSVRRTLIQLKAELTARTRFAVFEPNTESLWDSVENVVEQYLNECLQSGMLKGGTPDQAFYVKCDSETNPPESVANGEVHIEVGVALASPAEFIVIEIGQFDGAVVATEEV